MGITLVFGTTLGVGYTLGDGSTLVYGSTWGVRFSGGWWSPLEFVQAGEVVCFVLVLGVGSLWLCLDSMFQRGLVVFDGFKLVVMFCG